MNTPAIRHVVLIVSLMLSSSVFASPLVIGQPLPPVALSDQAGELRYSEGDIVYHSWSTQHLRGRTHLLYIVAARMGADKINQPLLDALEQAGGTTRFPADKLKVISLLNIDDVFPMGGGFARAAFEHARTQPQNAHAIFVLDDDSTTQKAWGYSRKSAAVIITGEDGRVLRYKDGALSPSEIDDYVQLLQTQAGLTQETP